MPTWAKVLLAIFAIIAALLIAAGFIGYHWVMKNKDQLMASRKEGAAFGRDKDAAQCIDTALSKIDGTLTKTIAARTFVAGCLTTASGMSELCATIPPRDEFMKRAKWTLDQCRDRGTVDQQGCSQVFQEVEQYCAHRR